jgi:uncharacterized protein (DUF58 family)
MALTSKGLAYLILAYVFIGLALIFREPSLTAFVVPNAILFLFSSRKPPVRVPLLRVTRRMYPPRSFGGENIDVTVRIQNDSIENIDELQLKDQIPESLKVESGSEAVTISMRPYEETQIWYCISAPKRGTYVLGPMSFRIKDMLGFHENSGEIATLDELSVLPKLERLGPIELRARRVGPWPGSIPSRKIGPGTEFFELRNYLPGDDLRRINWKASAKSGRLIANEFEGEQVTDVLVVVDCSEGTMSRLFDFDVTELEVSLAASLCAQLIHQGNRVGLSVYSAVRTWVDPGFGKRQLLRLVNSLAVVTPGIASVPLKYAVESVIVSVVPARSVIIFISPLMGDETIDLIEDLTAKGYGVMCFTPVAGSKTEDMTNSMILARRIFASERRIKLIDVSKKVRVIEFSPEIDVRYALRRWRLWRRA